jgi:hypothetical protein
MAKQLQSFSLAFLLFILIVPLFEAFEALDDFEKFEEKLGLKKHNEDSSRDSQVVTLTCDGPVTFDATIKFRTEFFAPDAKPPFFYSWSKSIFIFTTFCFTLKSCHFLLALMKHVRCFMINYLSSEIQF